VAIGDAAGLVKPTTGGGISYSLRSASWAAETLCEAFGREDFGSRCLAGYEDRWRATLGPELSVGMWFRRLAGWLTPRDLDALTRLAIEDGVVPIIRANARFDAHRDLIRASLRHPGILDIVLRRLFDRIVGRGASAASRAY
jgi:flavin-dependent dehydrogenase